MQKVEKKINIQENKKTKFCKSWTNDQFQNVQSNFFSMDFFFIIRESRFNLKKIKKNNSNQYEKIENEREKKWRKN